MKGSNQSGFAFWLEIVEGVKDGLELGGTTAGRNFQVDLFVTAGKAGRVALIDNEVGESGGDSLREFDLGGVVPGLEIHRPGGIDNEVGAQVGISLKLLNVVSIGAGIGFPIETSGVIARDVFTVFRELHGGAAVRRSVSPGDVAHHGKARLHRNGAETCKDVGIEEVVFHNSEGRGADKTWRAYET